MTNGQVFYFAGLAALIVGAIVEHYWLKRRRR